MFENSSPHGNGTMTYADGSVYSGQFDHGLISGQGTIVFPNGSKYGNLKRACLTAREPFSPMVNCMLENSKRANTMAREPLPIMINHRK
jgi:prepilin-type processing-associated H-X9-DG protein